MPWDTGVGKPWCDVLPVVNVPMGTEPKRLTLVVPYYECPEFYLQQVVHWDALANEYPFRVIVVDDGSPSPAPFWPHIERPWLRGFRIENDVPWNWLAARNIGAHHADDGWLLLTDMDHIVPRETLSAVLYGQHDPAVVYAFSRREHTGAKIHPHSASFLMTRAMFWNIGGYDERLSGVYGTDGAYRKRLTATAPVRILADELERHEYVADASVTTYERKTPAMRQAKARRFAGLTPGPPKVLSFPYHEVTV
jgi:hypothetical protein